MIIKSGLVYQNGKFQRKDLYTNGDKFSSSSDNDEVCEAGGFYVIPGLIDIHFHGAKGEDFSNGTEKSLDTILSYELESGVTSCCPATMTLPISRLEGIMTNAKSYQEKETNSRMLGINLEGPYLSEEKAGAQNREYLKRADSTEFRCLQEKSGGKIKLVTIAPEFEENLKFIEDVRNEVVISLGHSNAKFKEADEAFTKGANHVTHLFNAMRPLHHRESGLIGAAYEDKAYVEMICDGNHISDEVMKMAFKIFDEDKIILISDSMEGCGMPNGTYFLGDQKVTTIDKKAYNNDGTIAGSVSNLMDIMKYLTSNKLLKLETAIKFASENPAKSIGVFDKVGSLDEGKLADFLLVDKDLNIISIYKDGKLVK